MHKPVRYYITESNDEPVVRSVTVRKRQLDRTDRTVDHQETGDRDQSRRQVIRTSLSRRLKPHWPRDTNV